MSKTQGAEGAGRPETVGAKERPWEMRIWSGITVTSWWRLLWTNRFAVSPSRIGMAVLISMMSAVNSLLRLVQSAIFGRRIARTELAGDPIFVLGHWRSGTTLLHELLAADPRFTYADTYSSFAPNHFLLTGGILPRILKLLLPPFRPMDNMPVSWQHPQEDEWALCNMGVPSPYLTLAFANRPPQSQEYLDLRGVPAPDLQRWQQAFRWFLRCLTVRQAKPIVLKSPQHTCRIRTLLTMFPRARFVHIVRDPYFIFPSTIKTWKRMYKYHGLQVPRYEGLTEFVFKTFTHMYRVFEEDRTLVEPAQLCEVRYEDLVRDPVGQMKRIYDAIGLGDFEVARPAVEDYAARTAGYRPSRYELEPALREEISQQWSAYIARYGYGGRPAAAASGAAEKDG